jgi:hypothetical protein
VEAGKALADVGEREQIVAGERRVIERGERQRDRELDERRAGDVGGQFGPGDRAKLEAQHFERRDEEQQADDDGDGMT